MEGRAPVGAANVSADGAKSPREVTDRIGLLASNALRVGEGWPVEQASRSDLAQAVHRLLITDLAGKMLANGGVGLALRLAEQVASEVPLPTATCAAVSSSNAAHFKQRTVQHAPPQEEAGMSDDAVSVCSCGPHASAPSCATQSHNV